MNNDEDFDRFAMELLNEGKSEKEIELAWMKHNKIKSKMFSVRLPLPIWEMIKDDPSRRIKLAIVRIYAGDHELYYKKQDEEEKLK